MSLSGSASRQAPRNRWIRWVFRLAGFGAALAVAYFAQSILDVGRPDGFEPRLAWIFRLSEPSRLWVGSALYLAAFLIWLVASRPPTRSSRADTPASEARDRSSRWRDLLRASLSSLGLAGSAASMILFAYGGEDPETPLLRMLLVGGVALFTLSQLPLPFWRERAHPSREPSPPFRWYHTLSLAALLAGAFWLRFDRLATIPSDFHGDSASYGIQAREILLGGEQRFFREGWANVPMVGFLPAALFMRTFGNNLLGLKLSGAVGGTLSLLGLYLLVWRLFDRHRLAAAATAIAALNTTHIHFSRLPAYIDPWAFHVPGLFFLVDGLKGRRTSSLALSGVLFGLGLQMYYSGRVIVFVVATFFVLLLFVRRSWLFDNLRGLLVAAAAVLAALGPSLVFFAKHGNAFMERSRAVWIFSPDVLKHMKGIYRVETAAGVILMQLKQTLLMFHHSIDTSTQFGYPHAMFDSLVSPLIVLGLAGAFRRFREPGSALVLAWLAVMMVLGSVLTGEAPFWPRLVGLTLPAAFLAALAMEELQEHLAAAAGRAGAVLAGLGVVVLLYGSGRDSWSRYRATVANNARPQAHIGRFLMSLPPNVAACGFQDQFELEVRETAFLAWPRRLLDLPADAPDTEITACPGPPMVWILSKGQLKRLDVLRARWPGGIAEEHRAANTDFLFTSYLLLDRR